MTCSVWSCDALGGLALSHVRSAQLVANAAGVDCHHVTPKNPHTRTDHSLSCSWLLLESVVGTLIDPPTNPFGLSPVDFTFAVAANNSQTTARVFAHGINSTVVLQPQQGRLCLYTLPVILPSTCLRFCCRPSCPLDTCLCVPSCCCLCV